MLGALFDERLQQLIGSSVDPHALTGVDRKTMEKHVFERCFFMNFKITMYESRHVRISTIPEIL